jgi:hypothetical protein
MIDGGHVEHIELEKTVKRITVYLKDGTSFGHYWVDSVSFVKVMGKLFLRIDWETNGFYDFKMVAIGDIKYYHIVVDKQKKCDVQNLENGHITQEEFDNLNGKPSIDVIEEKMRKMGRNVPEEGD